MRPGDPVGRVVEVRVVVVAAVRQAAVGVGAVVGLREHRVVALADAAALTRWKLPDAASKPIGAAARWSWKRVDEVEELRRRPASPLACQEFGTVWFQVQFGRRRAGRTPSA